MAVLASVVFGVCLAVDQTDPIPGTNLDNIFLAFVAVITALVLLAAAAHKTPVKQLGQLVGWVFRRLVGEPISRWLRGELEQRVQPMVATSVQVAVAPLHAANEQLAARLVEHMDDEHQLVESIHSTLQGHTVSMGEHTDEDARQFGEIREWREGADRWRRDVSAALRYLVGEGGPDLTDPPSVGDVANS